MKNKGFTLVEILIVVVILGILAAIVIPQFSDASTQSKVSSAKSSLQTMRSQVQLYKIQHNDDAPPTSADLFDDEMLQYTDSDSTVSATKSATCIYGPYLQAIPINPFTGTATIAAADGATVGWVYTAATGILRLGGTGYTDLDGSGDATNANGDEETHLNW